MAQASERRAVDERQGRFAVTYEIITYESAEQGESDEDGYVHEHCTLREAIDALGGAAWGDDGSGTWFTNYEYDQDLQTGAYECRSLHPPETITPSSLGRVARALGL